MGFRQNLYSMWSALTYLIPNTQFPNLSSAEAGNLGGGGSGSAPNSSFDHSSTMYQPVSASRKSKPPLSLAGCQKAL